MRRTILSLPMLAFACSSPAVDATSTTDVTPAVDYAAADKDAAFRQTLTTADPYGLFTHDAAKTYHDALQSDACGGAYGMSTSVDLGKVAPDGVYVKSISFTTHGARTLIHQPHVWVGTSQTSLKKFTDAKTTTDGSGRPVLTFEVETWFPGGNEGQNDALRIQHTILPDDGAKWADVAKWGGAKDHAGIGTKLADDPDKSYCSFVQKIALSTAAGATAPGATSDGGTPAPPDDGTTMFCPERIVSRREVARVLVWLKHGRSFAPPPATGVFDDISGDDAAWAEQLAIDGVSKGCVPGSFCPDDPLLREQMAAFLIRTRDGKDYRYGIDAFGPSAGPFLDVPASDPFAGDIQKLREYAITKGCTDGYFCPKDGVQRQHLAAFVARFLYMNAPLPAVTRTFADVDRGSELADAISVATSLGFMTGCR